jgi:hypothetical protein
MKGHCNVTFYYACEYINGVRVLYSTFIILHSFKVNTLYIYIEEVVSITLLMRMYLLHIMYMIKYVYYTLYKVRCIY